MCLHSSSERRLRIVLTAIQLFSRYGFRKTSMDLIAREAGVAKPTIYAYFDNKEALFVAVCEQVGQGMLAQAHQASSCDLPLPERLSAILGAKFSLAFELVDASPHAQELQKLQDQIARTSIEAAQQQLIELLAHTLRAAEQSGELNLQAFRASPEQLAAQLMQIGHGASYGARNLAQQQAQLQALVHLVLRAGLPA